MGGRMVRIDRLLALWLASLVLTGCAGEVLPPVGPSHPASPEAPESPPTVLSTTLDIRTQPMPATAPPANAQKGRQDHSHGLPGMQMPGREMPGEQAAQSSAHDQSDVQPSTAPGRMGGPP
jgi:hypothetical protein